ncbi:dihydrofolate reductase [Cadophora gregata]|uniref:dihydrofolate reductase n=1 Tax=Cadophora gregata TaxID=51156 RepID=UPI0026DD0C1A|nr:dihydrofolate reductase [Cadophora gregata]KAK0103197.1 dihydrofolate reductase [Cadophora gregata f. sp. sojae]KAK0113300.1 dihydrofolate reductase [Cadophora gregata]
MSDSPDIISSSSDSSMIPQELTLIVAATNSMGIGRAGTLPWTGLKKEMAYFARVTRRTSPGATNTVIMGRKTWDSIPAKFRPLKDRTNIVVSRGDASAANEGEKIVAKSLSQAAEFAKTQSGSVASKSFVIGGAQIYKASLDTKEAKRILLTRVLSEFECDTFFPIMLREDGKASGWVRKSKDDLDRWTGETVPEGIQEENGIRYVFEMWERI